MILIPKVLYTLKLYRLNMNTPQIVFAGDRDIAVDVLSYLTEQNVDISALMLPPADESSHDTELLSLCDHLEQNYIIRGKQFREGEGVELLKDINPDYILAVHFQYIIPKIVLDIPQHGVVNLHPAYLPYNRGWHTPSWAIWEQTPYGATIHFMEEDVDAGDIIARKKIGTNPDDTADSLYNRAKKAELKLFKQAWDQLASFDYNRQSQSEEQATSHRKADLDNIREIKLSEEVKAETLIRKLRALTTNDIEEAAYFEKNNERYFVQIDIVSESKLEEVQKR